MRISFDIDDTLVCYRVDVPIERGWLPPVVLRRMTEPLRRGTRLLMQKLRHCGHEIWIYTTSGRTPMQVRWWLWLYGIHVSGVVNDERHRNALQHHRFARLPSKYPPAFGIDLHVDDSEGVRMEGEEHGFRVVVIQPNDERWIEKVIAATLSTSPAT